MGSGVPGVLQPGHDGLVTYCLRLGVDRGDGCFQTVRDVCFKSMGSSVPAGTGLWRATVWGAVPMCGVGLPSLWGSSVRTAQSRVRGAFLRCEGWGQWVGVSLGWKARGSGAAHRSGSGDVGWGWERSIGGVSLPAPPLAPSMARGSVRDCGSLCCISAYRLFSWRVRLRFGVSRRAQDANWPGAG